MVKVKDIMTREGKRHWKAKSILFDNITDNDCVFVSNHSSYSVKEVKWDYACMEAFCLKDGITIPKGCFVGDSMADNEEQVRYSEKMADYNKNICIKDRDILAYYNDPLNYCKFSADVDVRYIFDIALGRNGVYETVIEIEDNAPVKGDKKEFCRIWGIDLIVVKCNDVLINKFDGRVFKAEIYVNEMKHHLLPIRSEEIA